MDMGFSGKSKKQLLKQAETKAAAEAEKPIPEETHGPSREHTALMQAAGNLGCLKFLTAKGANLEATDKVRAAPPAAPSPLYTLAIRPK